MDSREKRSVAETRSKKGRDRSGEACGVGPGGEEAGAREGRRPKAGWAEREAREGVARAGGRGPRAGSREPVVG